MRIDLHLHSHYSDGKATPAETVRCAYAAGVQLLALTDHDAVGGLPEAEATADELGVRFIPGVEFTATLRGADLHILGYFPAFPGRVVQQHLQRVQEFRRRRMETALERLRQLGVQVERADVPAVACCESVTTMHLAELLVQQGTASSARAARRKYLVPGQGIVEPFDLPAKEIIDVIHAGGGLAVWAHPSRHEVSEFFANLLAEGLDGVEVRNPRRRSRFAYGWLHENKELLLTGGSDWHGEGQPGVDADGLQLGPLLDWAQGKRKGKHEERGIKT